MIFVLFKEVLNIVSKTQCEKEYTRQYWYGEGWKRWKDAVSQGASLKDKFRKSSTTTPPRHSISEFYINSTQKNLSSVAKETKRCSAQKTLFVICEECHMHWFDGSFPCWQSVDNLSVHFQLKEISNYLVTTWKEATCFSSWGLFAINTLHHVMGA